MSWTTFWIILAIYAACSAVASVIMCRFFGQRKAQERLLLTRFSAEWAAQSGATANIATVVSTRATKVTDLTIRGASRGDAQIPEQIQPRLIAMREAFLGLSNEDVRCLLLTHLDNLRGGFDDNGVLRGLDDQAAFEAALSKVRKDYERN